MIIIQELSVANPMAYKSYTSHSVNPISLPLFSDDFRRFLPIPPQANTKYPTLISRWILARTSNLRKNISWWYLFPACCPTNWASAHPTSFDLRPARWSRLEVPKAPPAPQFSCWKDAERGRNQLEHFKCKSIRESVLIPDSMEPKDLLVYRKLDLTCHGGHYQVWVCNGMQCQPSNWCFVIRISHT